MGDLDPIKVDMAMTESTLIMALPVHVVHDMALEDNGDLGNFGHMQICLCLRHLPPLLRRLMILSSVDPGLRTGNLTDGTSVSSGVHQILDETRDIGGDLDLRC